ncbi:hypothetical protein GQR58_000511 [Nymphon striatum]|nr:hypothetical protein GQR58_000511 [Nymphon striatum]
MHKRQDHRKVREQKPFHRFVNHAPRHQRRIGDAVAPQKRNPRNHPDDVGCPKRNCAQQEQRDLPCQAANVKGQIIRHGKPDQQRAGPRDQCVFECIEKDGVGHRRPKQECVIVPFKGRNDRKLGRAPKADNHDQNNRKNKENQQNSGKRRHHQPACHSRVFAQFIHWVFS